MYPSSSIFGAINSDVISTCSPLQPMLRRLVNCSSSTSTGHDSYSSFLFWKCLTTSQDNFWIESPVLHLPQRFPPAHEAEFIRLLLALADGEPALLEVLLEATLQAGNIALLAAIASLGLGQTIDASHGPSIMSGAAFVWCREHLAEVSRVRTLNSLLLSLTPPSVVDFEARYKSTSTVHYLLDRCFRLSISIDDRDGILGQELRLAFSLGATPSDVRDRWHISSTSRSLLEALLALNFPFTSSDVEKAFCEHAPEVVRWLILRAKIRPDRGLLQRLFSRDGPFTPASSLPLISSRRNTLPKASVLEDLDRSALGAAAPALLRSLDRVRQGNASAAGRVQGVPSASPREGISARRRSLTDSSLDSFKVWHC